MKKPIFRFSLRTNRLRKDGTHPVYYYYTISTGAKIYKSCNVGVPSIELWNEAKQRVKNNAPNSFTINRELEAIEMRAKNIISEFYIKGKVLPIAEFERLFENNYSESNTFFEFIEKELLVNLACKLAPQTLHNYKCQISKVKKFREHLSFDDVDFHFLEAYENYMLGTLKNNISTIDKTFRFVRTVYNMAIEKNVAEFEKYPFRKFHWKKPRQCDAQERALTIPELTSLQNLYNSNSLNPEFANILKYFLFCCYCGLRYSDVMGLQYKDIQDNFINLRTKKTNDFVRIPLIESAAKLIPVEDNNKNVFNVYTDQFTNRSLKDIAVMAGINKPVSFHWSRHTFATVCVEKGVPIEVISKLLGHVNLKTTQIYSKVSDSVKIREMNKLNFI